MPINPEHHSQGTLRKHDVEMTEVASVLVFQVCFESNFLEIKFQIVNSGMQVGGVSVQDHVSRL